jgi:hypothetical protein
LKALSAEENRVVAARWLDSPVPDNYVHKHRLLPGAKLPEPVLAGGRGEFRARGQQRDYHHNQNMASLRHVNNAPQTYQPNHAQRQRFSHQQRQQMGGAAHAPLLTAPPPPFGAPSGYVQPSYANATAYRQPYRQPYRQHSQPYQRGPPRHYAPPPHQPPQHQQQPGWRAPQPGYAGYGAPPPGRYAAAPPPLSPSAQFAAYAPPPQLPPARRAPSYNPFAGRR